MSEIVEVEPADRVKSWLPYVHMRSLISCCLFELLTNKQLMLSHESRLYVHLIVYLNQYNLNHVHQEYIEFHLQFVVM